jgi:hypothetical protein
MFLILIYSEKRLLVLFELFSLFQFFESSVVFIYVEA